MAIAERVQSDVVFPVEAQPDVAERNPEADYAGRSLTEPR
jgi:hypothetical protein